MSGETLVTAPNGDTDKAATSNTTKAPSNSTQNSPAKGSNSTMQSPSKFGEPSSSTSSSTGAAKIDHTSSPRRGSHQSQGSIREFQAKDFVRKLAVDPLDVRFSQDRVRPTFKDTLRYKFCSKQSAIQIGV